MKASLGRVILYVQDVERLSRFYADVFALPVVEHIEGEWAVLKAGACEIALHRAGRPYRTTEPGAKATSNAKLVITVDRDIAGMRDELSARGVAMREIKSYPGLTGPLCDGLDPEGNVFQLSQTATAAS